MALAALDLGTPTGGAGLNRISVAARGLRVVAVLRISIALLVIGNLGRVPVLDGGKKEAPLLFNDLLVGAILVAACIAALQSRRLVLDRPALVALAFAAVGALSAMLAVPRFGLTGFQFFFSIAYLVRWLVYFGVYLAVVNFVRPSDVERVWGTLEGAILVFAGFGVFQSLFLPGFAQMVQPEAGWDPQGHRLVSTFMDPNFAGGLIMLGLLVVLARISFGVPTSRWKPVLLLAALLMTVSRSSILAFVVGVCVILAMRGLSRRLLSLGGLLLVLLLPFVPLIIQFAVAFDRFSVGGSAAQRVIAWLQALEVIADSPLLGIGFNTYGYVQEFYNHADQFGGFHFFALDGGLLFIAVMTGIVGVSLYTAMLVLFFLRCRRVARMPSRGGAERGLAVGIAAGTVGIVVHSIFLNSLLFTLLMEPLWVLWGLSFALQAERDSVPAAAPVAARG